MLIDLLMRDSRVTNIHGSGFWLDYVISAEPLLCPSAWQCLRLFVGAFQRPPLPLNRLRCVCKIRCNNHGGSVALMNWTVAA